jgi:hypothetical protein
MKPASGEKRASRTGLESFSDHISDGLSDSDLDHRTRLEPPASSSSDEPHERAVGRSRTSQSLNTCTCDHFPPLLAQRLLSSCRSPNLEYVLLPSKGFVDVDIYASADRNGPGALLYRYRFERLDIVDIYCLEEVLRAFEDNDSIAGDVCLKNSSLVSTVLAGDLRWFLTMTRSLSQRAVQRACCFGGGLPGSIARI